MAKADYLQILREELVPALGCTEPIALAYGAAECRRILGMAPERIEARCSGNIVKNVKGVVVPNCGGLKGIEAAVVAGALYGDAGRGLEVLSSISDDDAAALPERIREIPVDVKLLETPAKLHFMITMEGGGHSASVEIVNRHTNISKAEKDGKVIAAGDDSSDEGDSGLADRSGMSVGDIIAFGETAPLHELEEIIGPQIRCNAAISREGFDGHYGAEVGRTIISSYASLDARITASMPVIVYAEEKGVSHEKLVRALAISNLVAIHQKTGIGRLSAYCGAVSAAAGAGAAVTWLEGGDLEAIDDTIVNTLATVSGMICDGAKPSCAGKIAVAVSSALLANRMAMAGRCYRSGEGIVKDDVEKTVSGIGQIASDGMSETDSVILSVMMEC